MRIVVVLLALMLPMKGMAQDVCGPQDYDIEIEPDFGCPSPSEYEMVPNLSPPDSIPVRAGETIVAQWDGAFVHRDRLVEMGLRIRALRRLRWTDRFGILSACEIQIAYKEEVAATEVTHARMRTDIYKDSLTTANSRVKSSQAWYRSWWFGYLLGVVSAGALVALTAYSLMTL